MIVNVFYLLKMNTIIHQSDQQFKYLNTFEFFISGKKDCLVSPDQDIEGKKTKLFNSLTLASNGDIYWTSSSSQFILQDGLFDILADPSGRLIHYNAKTGENTVLIDNIHFANGVALSHDEEFVIVAETARSRILRYYIKGPKKGTSDVFVDGLPGLPDNLRSDGKGGFLVPLVAAKDSENPVIPQSLGPFPLIRKLLARLMGLVELGFKTVDQIYPNEFCQKGVHMVSTSMINVELVNYLKKLLDLLRKILKRA